MTIKHLQFEIIKSTINNFKKNISSISINVGIALILICSFLTMSCALIKAKKDINKSQLTTVIIGYGHNSTGWDVLSSTSVRKLREICGVQARR